MQNAIVEHATPAASNRDRRLSQAEHCAQIADRLARGYAPVGGEGAVDVALLKAAQFAAERVAAAIREQFPPEN